MARISTYTVDGAPVSSDKLIGTDSSGVATKNYPLGSVADWLKESGASAVLGQTNYKFQVVLDPDAGREPGSISFSDYGGDGTEFISVSALMVSNLSSTGQYIGDYLLSTVGDRVMLGQLDDLNNFGVYRLVSLIQNPVEPTFFDAELLFVEGNGALRGNKTYGLATYSASASAGSAIWGSIEGAIANQTDLVEYIDTEISEIPAPTLETVTNEGNTTTNDITVNSVVANGTLQLSAYTAGLLQTDAAGNVSLDTTSYSTFSGNYDDLENKPYIPITGVDFDPVGTDNSTNVTLLSVTENYLSIFGQEITAGIVPISLGGTGAETAADARSSLNVDVAGTDNSTNVTLSGEYDYLTLAGQEITLEQIDYDTDILNTPILGTAAASAATDFVAVTGDTMTGKLTIDRSTTNDPALTLNSSSSGWGSGMRFKNTTTTAGKEFGIYSSGTGYFQFTKESDSYGTIMRFTPTNNLEIAADNLLYTGSGNVGIGTTSPAQKLHVVGNTTITGVTYTDIVQTYSGASIDFRHQDASVVMRVDTANARVGIGTASPGYKLSVNGDIHIPQNEYIYFDNTAHYIRRGSSDVEIQGFNGLQLRTNGSTRLYINQSGNVGIGTTAPEGKIDVRGGFGRWRINGYGGMYFRNNSDTGYTRYIHPRSDGSLSFGRIADANLSGSDPDKFAASSYDQFYLDSSGTAFFNGGINFAGVNGANFVVDTDGRRIVWEHQRNGTRKMSFYHETDADTFNFNFESGNKLQINGNRIVTVNELGTAAASAATDFVAVTGDTMTGDLIINKNNPRIAFSDQGAIMNMRYDGGIFYIDPASGSNRYVRITNSGAGSIDLSVDGNVGIGTTSPNAKLDVNNSAVGEYAYFGSGSTRQLRLSSYNTVSDHAGHKINASSGNGEITLATNSIAALTVKNDQTIQLNAYGVGYLKSDASGNITVDSDTIEDTLDSVTTRGNTTSNNITVGSITANGNITTNTGVFYSGNGTKLDLNQYNAGYLRLLTDNTERLRVTATGNVGIGTTSPSAPLDVRASSYKVIRLGNDITSHYTLSGSASHTLTLTCGSYHQAEVIITANQTNSGGYNNYYVRGIWSNNHTSHRWDVLEEVGYLTGSSFTFTNGQNDVANSGKLLIEHIYSSGSFGGMTVRVTDMFGTHSYTIA